MGLFKHDRERKRVQKADPPSLEDSSIRTWLRHLGKKHKPTSGRIQTQEECPGNDSASPALDSRPPSNHEGSRTTQSLWDRAYDTLAKDNGPLLKEYEELLMGARMTSSTSNDEPPAQVLSPDDLNRGIGGRSRQAQLEIIIAEGLQRVENKKKQYTIAGYEFSLTDQIARAADFILWAKDLIGEAVKQSPEASIAWAGVSIVLPLLTNPKVADDANRDGFTYVTTRMSYYAELETQIQRLDGDPEVSHALVMEAKNQIVILYRHILEFQIRSVLRFYRSRVSTYIHDVLPTDKWEQMRLEIEKDEGIVNENLRQINEFTSIQKLQSLDRTTRDKLEEVRLLLSVSKEQLRVAEDHLGVAKKTLEIQEHEAKRMLSDRQKACLQLFRLTSSSKDITYEWYKDRIESRVAGTCEWFLKHENFQRWLEQDSGPLLVSADPGCGKSVLAKYLVDEGLPRQTICYFFFKDHDQNTVRQALCALLHQLFKQNLSLLEHATNQFDQDGQGLIDSAKSLWTVFRNAVQDPRAGPLIIVLDALDECDETEFEDLMRNLENQFYSNQSNHSRLKYLLTSRPYEQIVSKFRYLLDTFPHIRIPGEDKSETIGQEVNHVIKHRVDRLAKEKRLPDDTKKHLERKLREIPNRTYLWAYLVFDFLNTEPFKKTPKGVDSTMATLPKNVYQAYEHILSKSKDHSMVRKALSIILAASRPLTITEMNVAMNIDNTSKSIHDLDLEDEINFKERLRTLCGLFVSVHHGKVYFLHQTAREFLLDLSSTTAIPPGLHWQNSITSSAAHMVLAELCVIYLDFLNFDDIPTDESGKTSQDLLHNYTFLDYAANNWGDHFGEACVGDNASILASTLRICDPALKSCSTWFGIYWEAYEGPGAPTRFTSLLIPSYLGHEVTVKLLLRKGANIEARDEEYGRTPLSWAAGSGHVMITKMLLEKGANIESRDEDYGQTPLMLAAMNGHVSVVELLLEKGADIKSIDKKLGRTPLIWAAMNGHVVVVELMLEKGADIECIDKKFGRTPLIWAVEGHVTVVELLLRKNANVESRDEFGRTPLSLAPRTGRLWSSNCCWKKVPTSSLKTNLA
ncbi:hypothetical protein F4861DRAFT_475858 [Xylaria intraflava]|nr:hypothetical protein F4861DRAFT_475858 [Xylaria intraflava]